MVPLIGTIRDADPVFRIRSDPDLVLTWRFEIPYKIEYLIVFVDQSYNTVLVNLLNWLLCQRKSKRWILLDQNSVGDGPELFFEGFLKFRILMLLFFPEYWIRMRFFFSKIGSRSGFFFSKIGTGLNPLNTTRIRSTPINTAVNILVLLSIWIGKGTRV